MSALEKLKQQIKQDSTQNKSLSTLKDECKANKAPQIAESISERITGLQSTYKAGNVDSEIASIKSLLSGYEKYFNQDFVSSANDVLDSFKSQRQENVKTVSRYKAMSLHEKQQLGGEVDKAYDTFAASSGNEKIKAGENYNKSANNYASVAAYTPSGLKNFDQDKYADVNSFLNYSNLDIDAADSESKMLQGKYDKALEIQNELDANTDDINGNSQYYNSFYYTNKFNQYYQSGMDYEAASNAAKKDYFEYYNGLKTKLLDALGGYRSVNELKTVISNQRFNINKAGVTQKRVNFENSATSNSDFEEWATKGGSDKGNVVATIRNNPTAVESTDKTVREQGGLVNAAFQENLNYKAAKHMTDSQTKIYNYYFAKEKAGLVDEGTSEKYLKSIEDELSIKGGEEIAEYYSDKPFGQYCYAATAGAVQFFENTANFFNFTDDYIAPSVTQVASEEIREDISERDGVVGTVAYDLINTSANMMPSILASTAINIVAPGAGTIVGAGLMGLSAAGGAYQEALSLGFDKGQARVYSTLVGTSEAIMSAAFSGISKLGGKITNNVIKTAISNIDKGFWKFAAEYGLKVLSEGLEEGAQEILSPIFKSLATNTDVEYWGGIDWGAVAYSALLGGLSAGLLEGIPGAVSAARKASANKALYSGSSQQLIDNALKMPQGSQAYKLANKYQQIINSGKALSGTQLGMLVEASQAQTKVSDASKITAAAELRLIELGERKNTTGIAKAIAKKLTGENTTRAENNVIKNSEYGQRVLNEAKPENVVSGGYASEWAKNIGTEWINRNIYNLSNNTQTTAASNTADNVAVQTATNDSASQNQTLQSTADGDIINQNTDGGTDNVGEQGLLRDGGQWSGTEGANTQVPSGTLPQTSGGVSGIRQENQRGLQRESALRDSGDNRGVELTPEQDERLKDTVVINVDGTPMVLYHFTDNMDFDVFGEGDIGFHFGSEAQAAQHKINLSKQGKLQGEGRTIKVHLAIKNPIYIPTDIMSWQASQTALMLFTQKVITNEQYIKIRDLQLNSGGTYNTPAAIELRRILAEKGYDGIKYQNSNFFEGEGESYIAFYPEQVIIIDDGKGNTQAGSNESASIMPENDAQGDFDGQAETDATKRPKTQAERNMQAMIDATTGKNISKTDKAKRLKKEIKRYDPKTDGQKEAKRVADELGLEVVFEDTVETRGSYKNGYIDKNGVIHIDFREQQPAKFVLVHELTHYCEETGQYKKFTNALRKSKLYEEWLRETTKMQNATREEMEARYHNAVIEQRGWQDTEDKVAKADREMIADFCGTKLFGVKDTVNMQSLLDGLTNTERRTVLQLLRDFVKRLGAKLTKNTEVLKSLDLAELERLYSRMYNEAKNNPTENGEVRDSIGILDNGNTYVIASRKVIKGTTLKEQRNDITNFFKRLLKNKSSLDIPTIEGDVLTITMEETADKARDNYKYIGGQRVKMSNDEFRVKLNVEAHIDEIAETSISDKRPHTNDEKNHGFAEDGFTYRTAYFEDFDGQYYKVRFSVGHNGTIATVYNVGKIEESVPSSAKLIAVVGSQALDGSLSNNSILNDEQSVNTYSMQDNENYSEDTKNSITVEFDDIDNSDSEDYNYDTHYGENLHNTPDYLKPTTDREWQVFCRSFANKTNGMTKGERRNISIFTENYQYLVDADGYMSGVIYSKIDIDNYESRGYIYDNIRDADDSDRLYEIIGDRQGNDGDGSSTSREETPAARISEMVSFIESHPEWFGDNRENYEDYKRRVEAENKTSAFSMPENTKDSITVDLESETEESETEDFTEAMSELSESFKNGEISRDDFMHLVDELYKEAGEKHGTVKQGESVTGKENFDNPVPKRVKKGTKVRTGVRTILEGGNLTPEMISVTKQQLLSGDISYTPSSNEKVLRLAEQRMANGNPKRDWQRTVNGDKTPSAVDIAVGELLLKQAVESKDAVGVVELTAELVEVGTRLGQAVQALSLLKRMDGLSQLVYVQRCVDGINRDLAKKFGKKFGNKIPAVKINEDMALQLAQSTTEADFDISYSAIMQHIANQVPSTFLEQFNAWRYMAMLFNTTTHIRNFLCNAVFIPSVKVKNILAATMEKITLDGSERTKTFVLKKEYKDFAKKDFANVEDILSSGGKMNPKTSIADNKRIFKSKFLETIRKSNFELLEKEDMIFLRYHYAQALGGYLQARKVGLENISHDELQKARLYAMGEALKATYRDVSKVANIIARISNSSAFANILTEGVLPFKKTPINIVKRGVEYSPLGLVKTVGKAVYDLNKGTYTATEFIDGLASNLTGSGVMILGMLLASCGVITGGFDDDDEAWFRKLMGEQEYSVVIGNKSYTIDWLAPACIPFFMGVAIAETWDDNSSESMWQGVAAAVGAGLEPIVNLSMLSGIQDTIASVRYADAGTVIQTLIGNMIGNYFSQLMPTITGKLANTIDDTRRTTYIDKNSDVPRWLQSAYDTVAKKTPWLSQTRQEYINAWGETENTGEVGERLLSNFISPGYFSEIEKTEISEELQRLAKATGENSVYPDTAKRYFSFKGYTKQLSREEYTVYATVKGQTQTDYLHEMINNKAYKKLTDEQKAKVISNLYKFANAKAKTALSYTYDELNSMHDGAITKEQYNRLSERARVSLAEEYFMGSFKTVSRIERNGGSVIDYYVRKAKE